MRRPSGDRELRVRVRLFGVLRTAAKREDIEVDLEERASVRQLVSGLVKAIARDEFEMSLIDADLRDTRPNALIMVSGTEISALNGLDTALKDGDEVAFLPVAHGGSVRHTLLWNSGSVALSAR